MLKATQTRLNYAFGSEKLGKEMAATIVARAVPSANLQKALTAMLTGRATSKEVIAAISSGLALSKNTKSRIIIALADAKAGNDLINSIQSIPTAKIAL